MRGLFAEQILCLDNMISVSQAVRVVITVCVLGFPGDQYDTFRQRPEGVSPTPSTAHCSCVSRWKTTVTNRTINSTCSEFHLRSNSNRHPDGRGGVGYYLPVVPPLNAARVRGHEVPTATSSVRLVWRMRNWSTIPTLSRQSHGSRHSRHFMIS